MKFALATMFALLSGCAWQARGPVPLLLTFADGTCSATAIAPHAILTATHCFNNGEAPQSPTVVRRLDDGNDHTLLIVADDLGASARFAEMPKPGTIVHILGNPGDLRALYAEGTVAGTYNGNALLNLPIFYGDSGAAVFDGNGRIVGMVSGIRVLAGGGVIVQWGEAKPFKFTAAQWREAGL